MHIHFKEKFKLIILEVHYCDLECSLANKLLSQFRIPLFYEKEMSIRTKKSKGTY